MDKIIAKYADKLVKHGLADMGQPLLGGLDAELLWNREDPLTDILSGVFERLNINSLLYCRPASPYAEMIEYLAQKYGDNIQPEDTETRTFLHDLPISNSLTEESIVQNLSRRKSVILPGGAISTYGTVSPEEAFVLFSSVCFSCYVKFMNDCLALGRKNKLPKQARKIISMAYEKLPALPDKLSQDFCMVEKTEFQIHRSMAQAGSLLVSHGLLDSYFGNVSFLSDDVLHISQTGSSLDELIGCIDPCPLDGSSSVGITASSELTAHLRILEKTGMKAVLHGHPKFSVIASLACEHRPCKNEGRCHLDCKMERSIGGVPIVSGEVGTGRYGLCNTVPTAIKGNLGVIVYGHGVFTVGKSDFKDALINMFNIEQMCRDNYFSEVGL